MLKALLLLAFFRPMEGNFIMFKCSTTFTQCVGVLVCSREERKRHNAKNSINSRTELNRTKQIPDGKKKEENFFSYHKHSRKWENFRRFVVRFFFSPCFALFLLYFSNLVLILLFSFDSLRFYFTSILLNFIHRQEVVKCSPRYMV